LCAAGLWLAPSGADAARPAFSFEDSQTFLNTYCRSCHEGNSPAGGFHLRRVSAPSTVRAEPQKWVSLAARVRNGEMPPKGAPAPAFEAREQFTDWVHNAVRAEACAAGIVPGASIIRRLNRDEYAATLRDLLDIHLDIGRMLPADGAGGEGFDNAAETLFLSPLHAEKYMEVAKFAVEFAAKEHKSRAKILVAMPGPGLSPGEAAQRILRDFLPRAFRKPVDETTIGSYVALFHTALKRGQPFDEAVFFALRSALVSPEFLFLTEPLNTGDDPRALDQYSMASRLSYFLWGSMPDELLFDIAAAGKLHDREVLRQIVRRMLRNDRSLGFTQRFVEQWLRTRELGGEKSPDPELFPSYATDEELRSDIRFQPILFFRELLIQDLSLLNLLESKHTIGTRNLARHYEVKMPLRPNMLKQPHWLELPEGTHRGGLLGMSAVLAVSSHPYRTSPVLRGAWILDSILGTPPPPPPPDVPALEEAHQGAAPKSVRERLSRHRANPACASCHDRIDPLGFALENFDPIGRWRHDDAGRPVDSSGELADGAKFRGPDELKQVLLARKGRFIRNLTAKLFGYALGRGLTLQDSCAVEAIAAHVEENGYRAQALIDAIVWSTPFRYQAPAPPLSKEQHKR
jgi:hypothetical protein